MSKSYKYLIQALLVSVTALGLVNYSAASDNKYPEGFSRGIIVKVDGKDYRLVGIADTANGITDVPGHEWAVVNKDELIGRHYNTGPFGSASFWSSDAGDGALLYSVRGKIDEWSLVKSVEYFNKGFVHYHELISMNTGLQHPTKVLWLSHAAVTFFTLDRGPHPELSHNVTSGLDYNFIPNWNTPYGQ
jgi:selenium-binding protein 1